MSETVRKPSRYRYGPASVFFVVLGMLTAAGLLSALVFTIALSYTQ